ncbi:hypothetical protein Tco_1202942 [Tanacetum coccineum]
MAESSSQKTSSPEITPKEEPVTLDKPQSPKPFLPSSQVGFTFDKITFTTNNEVVLLYPLHPNQDYFEAISDFISKCCLKEAFTKAPNQYKEYLSEVWYTTKTLDDSKIWISSPIGGVRGDIGIITFRNALRAEYLPHSSMYVPPPSITIVEFKRISLTGFRSCASRSRYRSVSQQTTRLKILPVGDHLRQDLGVLGLGEASTKLSTLEALKGLILKVPGEITLSFFTTFDSLVEGTKFEVLDSKGDEEMLYFVCWERCMAKRLIGLSGFGIGVGELTLSSLDVLQGFSFFLQMGFTLILVTLDGLDVGLLRDVIGEDDCDDDG